MTAEIVESNTLGMKHRHTHITIECWRNTKATSAVHATDSVHPYCTANSHTPTFHSVDINITTSG